MQTPCDCPQGLEVLGGPSHRGLHVQGRDQREPSATVIAHSRCRVPAGRQPSYHTAYVLRCSHALAHSCLTGAWLGAHGEGADELPCRGVHGDTWWQTGRSRVTSSGLFSSSLVHKTLLTGTKPRETGTLPRFGLERNGKRASAFVLALFSIPCSSF